MKKILSALAVFVLIGIGHIAARPAGAELIFSDTFSGGYSPSWQVPAGTSPPVTSPFGITGSNISSLWSVIRLPVTENNTYIIKLDLKVNDDKSNSAWGLGISNISGQWKYIGNWGQQNLLQIHDSSGSDLLTNWDHSIGIHHFELLVSPKSGTPIIVKEDGKQINSLNSSADFDIKAVEVSVFGHGDYEMANFVLSTYEAPTPTPTSTPTPTPTPTSTPTPTPTPVVPNKVLIVHGAGGSWNKDALLHCKTTDYAGTWSPWKIKDKDVYLPLIRHLQQDEFIVLPFYYDWRKTAQDTADRLHAFIQANAPNGERVDIVAHSFGGIVGRAYLAAHQTDSQLNSFLTVGSPHQGTVFAYPAWSGGEMWINDISMRLGFTMMQIGCATRHGWSAREMVQNVLPATQNILPVFDYLKKTNGDSIPVSQMTAQNNLLQRLAPLPASVRSGTITGTGFDTLRTITVQQPNAKDTRQGNWQDGKPTGKTYADGDGTVPAESSTLPDAENINLPLDHTALITHQTGMDTITDFLHNKSFAQPVPEIQSLRQNPQKLIPAQNISALLIVVDGARATLTDKDGNKTQDTEGQITILEPHKEAYTLNITPLSNWWWRTKAKVIIVQLFDDGTSAWKEYSHSGLFHRKWKLRFDHLQKRADILRDK